MFLVGSPSRSNSRRGGHRPNYDRLNGNWKFESDVWSIEWNPIKTRYKLVVDGQKITRNTSYTTHLPNTVFLFRKCGNCSENWDGRAIFGKVYGNWRQRLHNTLLYELHQWHHGNDYIGVAWFGAVHQQKYFNCFHSNLYNTKLGFYCSISTLAKCRYCPFEIKLPGFPSSRLAFNSKGERETTNNLMSTPNFSFTRIRRIDWCILNAPFRMESFFLD